MARPNKINWDGGWKACAKCPRKFQPGRKHHCFEPVRRELTKPQTHTFEKQLNPWMSKFVYLMNVPEHGYYKIGYAENVAVRLSGIQTSMPFAVIAMAAWETYHYGQMERAIHKHFTAKHIRGEWFKLSDEDVLECHRFAAEWLDKHPSVNVINLSPLSNVLTH